MILLGNLSVSGGFSPIDGPTHLRVIAAYVIAISEQLLYYQSTMHEKFFNKDIQISPDAIFFGRVFSADATSSSSPCSFLSSLNLPITSRGDFLILTSLI